jgi:hypothetical protein
VEDAVKALRQPRLQQQVEVAATAPAVETEAAETLPQLNPLLACPMEQ